MSNLIIEVCKVKDIKPHPNADRLEIIEVKGWSTLYEKGKLKKGDLMIYVPPDAILPENILNKMSIKISGGRVRTIKLRGVISQGLLLDPKIWLEGKKVKLGMDVKDDLGITKWEPQVKQTNIKGSQTSRRKMNPLFCKYTNIDNIKNYDKVFKKGDQVVITEKIHGTNFRAGNLPVYTDNFFKKLWFKLRKQTHEFCYGSHNVQLIGFKTKNYYPTNVYGSICKKYDLNKIIPKGYIFFGEIYGKGIQDLTYGIEDIDVVFFDIYDTAEQYYLDQNIAWEIFEIFGLPTPPILYQGKYGDKRTWKKFADGTTTLGDDNSQIREGIVIRSRDEEFHASLGRKILKAISDEYYLRKDGTEFH